MIAVKVTPPEILAVVRDGMDRRASVMVQTPEVVARLGDALRFGDLVQQEGADPNMCGPLPWVDVWCSDCGLVDQCDGRDLACLMARRHADDVHDGDVDREGWT